VKGNHEDASGFSRYYPKYYPYPYVAMTPKVGAPDSFNNLYWSFDYGPVHFTVIDQYSPYTPGSAQYAWAVNDLATTTKPWKILVYHHPAWTAGTHENNVTTQQVFDPLIKRYGVDLVYSGHNHNYARCQVNDQVEAAGDSIVPRVPYITNGGGGAGLYNVDTSNTGAFRHVVKARSEYEYLTFEVRGPALTMKAWTVTKPDGSRLSASTYNASTISTLLETVTMNHPVAEAGADRTVGTADQCDSSIVGTATEAEAVPLQFRWLEGETERAPWSSVAADGSAPLAVCGMPIGHHALTLQVTDGKATVSDAMVLTISDTTPPTLTAKANRSVLWPPNHELLPIAVETSASDNGGGAPVITATITSNEPQDGLGDGDTASDWTAPVVDATGHVSLTLRAERGGSGTGREYTISVTATDAAGNATTVPVKVRVPHDL